MTLTLFFFLIEGYETSLSEGLHFEKRLFHSTFSTVSSDWLVSSLQEPLATICLVSDHELTEPAMFGYVIIDGDRLPLFTRLIIVFIERGGYMEGNLIYVLTLII